MRTKSTEELIEEIRSIIEIVSEEYPHISLDLGEKLVKAKLDLKNYVSWYETNVPNGVSFFEHEEIEVTGITESKGQKGYSIKQGNIGVGFVPEQFVTILKDK